MARFDLPGGPLRPREVSPRPNEPQLLRSQGGDLSDAQSSFMERERPRRKHRRFLLWSLALVAPLVITLLTLAWWEPIELFNRNDPQRLIRSDTAVCSRFSSMLPDLDESSNLVRDDQGLGKGLQLVLADDAMRFHVLAKSAASPGLRSALGSAEQAFDSIGSEAATGALVNHRYPDALDAVLIVTDACIESAASS